MDRRAFLRGALLAAPVLVAVPSAIAYFLPPRGGWPFARTQYLVNEQAVYYFSGPTSYLESLALSSIPKFGGKWTLVAERPGVLNPCAELRTTYRTYRRGVEQTFCIQFDEQGVTHPVVEPRDHPHVVVGPITWEKLVEARALGPDGAFTL